MVEASSGWTSSQLSSSFWSLSFRFVFIFVTAMKSRNEASLLGLSLPSEWHGLENFKAVFEARDRILLRAMRNSLTITVASVSLLVVLASMVGYVLQRRNDRLAKVVSAFLLAGLIVPPAVVPTIYVLQKINLFKSLWGLILIEVAYLLPFAVLLFRAFASTDSTRTRRGSDDRRLLRHAHRSSRSSFPCSGRS